MTTSVRQPVAEDDSPGEPDEQWESTDADADDSPGEPDEPWEPDTEVVQPAGQ